MNYIILNNINSNTINGLLIQELPPITKPAKRVNIETIDGRDGDISTFLGYSAYDKTITIGLYGNYDIDQIISYFNTSGTVVFSNEPDKYYNYEIVNQIDFERLVRFRTATVTMHVQPFKYLVGEQPITKEVDLITGEGTDITLNNTIEEPFVSFEVKGDTQQATGESKNKLKNLAITETKSGVTFTFNEDKTITANGTAEYNIYYYILKTTDNYLLPAGDYILSVGIADIDTYDIKADITIGNHSYSIGKTDEMSASVTEPAITTAYIYVKSGTVLNNVIIKPMIRLSTEDNTYKPYGEFPSPYYPSEIRNVEGKNKFDENNLVSINYASFSVSENVISITGTRTDIAQGVYYAINVKKNTDYKITGNIIEGDNSLTKIAVQYRENDQSSWGNYQQVASGLGEFSFNINTGNYEQIRILLYCWSSAISSIITAKFKEIMVSEKGGDYVPYGCIQIKKQNKNFFTGLIKGKGINGTTGAETTSTLSAVSDYIPVDFNTNANYYLSGITSTISCFIGAYNSSKQFLGRTGRQLQTELLIQSNSFIAGTPQGTGDIAYLRVTQYDNGDPGTIDDIDNLKIQLEIGNSATNFVEHAEKIYNFPLSEGQKLYEDSTLQVDGIHNTRGQFTLDGTETYTLSATLDNVIQVSVNAPKDNISKILLCNYFIAKNSFNNTDVAVIYNSSNNRLYFYVPKTIATTKQEFATWITTHNILIEYELAEEEIIPYTEGQQEAYNQIQNISSYNEVTYINSIGDLPAILEAGVYGDNSITIINSGNIGAKPTFTIYGEGDIGVYLNEQQLFQIALGDEELITLDIANMEAYNPDTQALKNRLVTGDYNNFILNPGTNTLRFTGIVSKVEVSNYSRWI